ncbi:PAS domain-containing protein [Microvirga sp. 17 mud 1-3]|uniref:PAS domain-containing protein n=1 Tax=Microvirga sp. 17 mud 1-3 TaxID=2082949 RepID=UPI000D6BE157|nr:PAS domain-containing protein [Microvirga sp. 17 mud 1-3]AWM89090.1 hybrid sensor histidine kinase/response regulator [Microvirga sp. 17 mud 1-3]
MGALMRAHDWPATPLGSPAGWPKELKALVGVMLGSRQPMYIVWGPGHTLLYNDGFAEILARKHPAALGRPVLEAWSEIRDHLLPLIERAYAGEPVHIEDLALTLERRGYPEEAHFSFSYTPVREETGAVAGFFCLCTEITSQVIAERRLAAETERQRRLFEQAPGFIAILSGPEHVFEFANQAYMRLSGNRKLVGKTALEVFPEATGQAFLEWLDQVYASGERVVAHDVPVRLHRSAGAMPEIRFLNFIYEPVTDEAGRVTGIFVEGHDVTETHQAQAALAASNARYTSMLAAMSEGFVILDQDFRITEINAEGLRLDGRPAREILGRTYWEVFPATVGTPIEAAYRRAMSERVPVELEHRYVNQAKGLDLWLALRFYPIPGGVAAFYRDISDRKRAEAAQAQALRQTEDALRQAQKMEAVGQLTGGIAHDFNNLLTGIIGALDLMQTRISQGRMETVGRYANAAMDSAQRAAALTHRLLAFSRRQPLAPKPVDANDRVASMEELLRRTLGPLHALEIVRADGLWTTRCDPNQLETALLNLAINARDAMPDGGQLTIETANAEIDGASAASLGITPGQYVAVSVADTGTGMPPEVIAHVFEPFFTTKPEGQGTGLGLAMVYGFAKQSEGHLRIESEVSKGTTIRLYLPRHHGAAVEEVSATIAAQQAVRTGAGETVLIVEDEPLIRDLITEVLQDLGYRTLAAVDGRAALKILRSHQGRIDLLVTDLGLPGINGRDLAEGAQQARPDVKVLFITGYAENAALANGFLKPGMDLVTKPFAVDALAARIRSMIQGG